MKSANGNNSVNKTRQIVMRLLLLVIYIGLGATMILTGKQHTILIDNKDAADGSYKAIDGMSVQIDKLEPAEYYAGDRDKAIVKGQKHKVLVEIFEGGKKVEKEITIPFGQSMVLLSIPKLVNGVEPYMEPFTIQEEAPAESEQAGANPETQFGGSSAEQGASGSAGTESAPGTTTPAPTP